eukprot:84664-Rhodomonas_salina.5
MPQIPPASGVIPGQWLPSRPYSASPSSRLQVQSPGPGYNGHVRAGSQRHVGSVSSQAASGSPLGPRVTNFNGPGSARGSLAGSESRPGSGSGSPGFKLSAPRPGTTACVLLAVKSLDNH